MAGPLLAIDFGTTNTVAALRRTDGGADVVEFDGARALPSVLFVEDDGHLVVGAVAAALLPSRPERGLRSVKSLLGRQAPVVLAGRTYPVVELVAAILAAAGTGAAQRAGRPVERTVLTHPADWNRRQLDQFRHAVERAGLPAASYLPEPVAAAASWGDLADRRDGTAALVYDLGGGTLDTAVVQAGADGLRVLGTPRGERTLGGDLFDEALCAHLGATQLDPADWQALCVAGDADWARTAASFRDEVRRAKELLSAHPYAPVSAALPSGLRTLRLTRDDAFAVLLPFVEESVHVARRTLADAGLGDDRLTAVAITGGAARLPIVAATVAAAFPTVPTSLAADPAVAAAVGALRLSETPTAPTAPTAPASVAAPAALAPAPTAPTGGAAPAPAVAPRRRRVRSAAVTALLVAAAVLITALVVRDRDDRPDGGAEPLGTGSTPTTASSTAGRTADGTAGTGTGSTAGTAGVVNGPAAAGGATVLDVLRSDRDRRFTVLVRCFEQAELTGLLTGGGPITLVAATDEALLAAGTDCGAAPQPAAKAALVRLLRQQVVRGAVVFGPPPADAPWASTAIAVGDGEVVDSELSGSPVVFEPSGVIYASASRIFSSSATTTDLVAANGVIQVVDRALNPPPA